MSTEHNPDNLTPEQVGEGWRLLKKDEAVMQGDEFLCGTLGWLSPRGTYGKIAGSIPFTYRRRITPDAGKAEAETLILEETPELQSAEALREYKERTKDVHIGKYGAPAQQPAQEPCLTCEGHGIIGGYEGSGNDMSPVGYPCPDCNPPAQQPAEAMPETEDSELSRLRDEIERIKKEESERFEHIREALATERAAREQAEKERDELKAECERLAAIIDKDFDKVTQLNLKSLNLDENGLNMHMQAEVIPMFGALLAAILDAGKAENYVECRIDTPRHGPCVMTFQKVLGKTPHQLRESAEHERDSLATRLAESESREHQLREVLKDADQCIDRLSRTIANKGQRDDEETRWARNREACETGDRITAALATPASTTVADLRKRAETAERERDAAIPSACPITGAPFFMMIGSQSDPTVMVPTFGGPFDSYTMAFVAHEKGKPLHEREISNERYDHDEGSWKEGSEVLSIRLIDEEELLKLQDQRDEAIHECDAAVKDRERLDWLERVKPAISFCKPAGAALAGCSIWAGGMVSAADVPHIHNSTLRAAIDAALAATQETK